MSTMQVNQAFEYHKLIHSIPINYKDLLVAALTVVQNNAFFHVWRATKFAGVSRSNLFRYYNERLSLSLSLSSLIQFNRHEKSSAGYRQRDKSRSWASTSIFENYESYEALRTLSRKWKWIIS